MIPDPNKPATDWANSMPLIHKYCRAAWGYAQARGLGLEYDDLFQEGSIAWMKARDKFNPELGYKFTTFLGFVVHQALGKVLRERLDERGALGHVRSLEDRVHLEGDSELGETLFDQDQETPEQEVENEQNLERLLDQLSPLARMTVELTLFPPKQIAEECRAWGVKNTLKAERQMPRSYGGTRMNFSFVIQRILPMKFGPISRVRQAGIMEEIRRAQLRITA